MLAIARKAAIRERLHEHKSVRITELAAELNVTKETIRRDLREMEQGGELIRTHGGAYILDGVQNDIDVGTRQVLKIPEKERIAQKCDSIIQSGDYIYLDGSTTCWSIARKVSHRKLTVLTSSLEIANILSPFDTAVNFPRKTKISSARALLKLWNAISWTRPSFPAGAYISAMASRIQTTGAPAFTRPPWSTRVKNIWWWITPS